MSRGITRNVPPSILRYQEQRTVEVQDGVTLAERKPQGEAWGTAAEESGGSQPTHVRLYQGADDPVNPTNTDFLIQVPGSPNTSGTFKLTFDGEETAAIAFDATGDEIAAALAALSTVGDGNAVAYPGYGDSTPNDSTYVLFAGDFVGQAVATPTVTSDTTDNGVETVDDVAGSPGTPSDALSGDIYVKQADGIPGSESPAWVLDAATVPAWVSLTTWGGVLTDGNAVVTATPGQLGAVGADGGDIFDAQTGGVTMSRASQVNFRNADPGSFPGGIPGVFWIYPYDPIPGAAWWISQGGVEAMFTADEPADGDINPGECFSFFDATNGAAKFIRKGKTLDGTVVRVESAMT